MFETRITNGRKAPVYPSFATFLGAFAAERVAALRGIGLLTILVAASACGRDASDKLQGKWVGDRIDNVNAEQLEAATAWVKSTTLEFAGDKLTVTIPAEQPRKGTFKVAREEGEKLVLSIARRDPAGRDETTLTLADPKTLRWDIGQNREVTLVRVQ